ncbi:unnamed protein product [Zymoseptoria tritici ST99CH_1A5]|uniref:FAD-binding PCMH-type domain-containing protein n=2 Tax=Zymoseptoria tritici TaxID=1047171 RepID=F9X6F8_ZYMTI|nr:uncharacterized protein MYCGRDRAFT_92069 [Zymoseptoria tritici IPO323]EGP89034.1 hypothetical protein MYCGRDRAFT_92069 [Zymoseptoria tritici IPO323]SMR50291.1 unnamed protein product [Zymoseptoria tritici ST99CH_3D1]SMY22984.1 unnamed protein product [Zymoseptoria tritici ST99CH_1A5]
MILSVTLLAALLLERALGAADGAGSSRCRCVPSLPCWPSNELWNDLNTTISGQLVLNHPVAVSCYPGPAADSTECASITANYTNNDFLQQFPIGYSASNEDACPVVNVSTSHCDIGSAPFYTVNATDGSHVSAGIDFARKYNLRLVVRNTGHDLLDRSVGFGSLQIWIRYLRTGITFHDSFRQKGSEWTGAAVTIGGGYVWREVYAEAEKRGVVVVGGGTPSVGCLGGWMQGGGHGPPVHDFGLGADQVLQARVVLANGSLVTASPRESPDLFFAIRGGGPGTYGIVVETTIKAWPIVTAVAQTLYFAPRNSSDLDTFMTALTDLYQAFPYVTQAGWSGYGQWSTAGVLPFPNTTIGYSHTMATFNRSLSASTAAFAPTLEKLQAYNGTSLTVSVAYTELPSYAAYYRAFSGIEPPAGGVGSESGRFLDEKALCRNRTALRETLDILAGTPEQATINVNEIFGAPYGRIAADGRAESVSSVTPAWREMVINHIVSRQWKLDTAPADVKSIQDDVLLVKEGALRKLAPDTGSYMNEANKLDPDYKINFYGTHYARLESIKRLLDPEGVFYCPTCVGSDGWLQQDNGQLCRA